MTNNPFEVVGGVYCDDDEGESKYISQGAQALTSIYKASEKKACANSGLEELFAAALALALACLFHHACKQAQGKVTKEAS